jgi:hypothetical protein
MYTIKDSAGVEVITIAQLVAQTHRGRVVKVRGGEIANHPERKGFYTVDGKGIHSLTGLRMWLGSYHYEFGEAVFYPA